MQKIGVGDELKSMAMLRSSHGMSAWVIRVLVGAAASGAKQTFAAKNASEFGAEQKIIQSLIGEQNPENLRDIPRALPRG